MPALQKSSTSYSAKSPAKGKRKKSATTAPAATPKQLFEFDAESFVLPNGRGVSFDDSNFEVVLKNQKTAASRRIGRNRRAALVFQSSPR